MSNPRPTIFVLWGRHFDEAVTAIFVTELRAAGVRVKVVGLEGRTTAGAHGLSLAPDLALGQLPRLAQRITGIVIPCSFDKLQRFMHDPRLAAFFQTAQQREVRFIVQQGAKRDAAAIGLSPTMLIEYPGCSDLVLFVRTFATQLCQKPALLPLQARQGDELSTQQTISN